MPWYRLVGVAKTSSETQRRKSQAARKSKWPPRVRGRQSSPTLEVRLGEQARLVKTVKIQVRWAAAQPGQDRRLPSGDKLKALAATSVRSRVGSSSKTAPGSLSTGSPAGRTLPHRDGSMYRQAHVSAGKTCGSQLEGCRPCSWTLKKVLREADGSVKLVVVRPHTDGKVLAPGCDSKAGR